MQDLGIPFIWLLNLKLYVNRRDSSDPHGLGAELHMTWSNLVKKIVLLSSVDGK